MDVRGSGRNERRQTVAHRRANGALSSKTAGGVQRLEPGQRDSVHEARIPLRVRIARHWVPIVLLLPTVFLLGAVTLVLTASSFFGLVDPWPQERVDRTKRIGDEVVAALERFERDSGVYPEHLSDLVPTYLPLVRDPVVGEGKWSYDMHTWQWPGAPRESYFTLWCRTSGGYHVLQYSSRARRWVETDQ